MPGRISPGFRNSMRTFAVLILGSRIAPILLMRPLNLRPGYALTVMSAVSPKRTLARSFSYTSQRIQMLERSEIVNGFAEERLCTPDEFVTCWSVITPEIGALTSTIALG